MAVSPTKKDSNRSPVFGSSKGKRIWEIKSKLVKKRLMDLSSINNNKINEGSVNVDKRIICYSPKEKSTNDLHSFDGLSSSSAMDRAQEIQEKLPLNSPSFLKNLLRSHVTQGFWLGLPRQFCVAHLPNHDGTVMLVVENEKEEHSTKYLAEKHGLSAGWRGFSIAHKLVEGDVCVFQLIKPCKLKVHIVRASALTKEVVSTCALTEEVKDGSSLSEVNAARSLINLYAYPIEAVKMDEDHEDRLKENGGFSDTIPLQSLNQTALNHKPKKRKLITINNNSDADEQSVPERTSHGHSFSKSPLNFDDVKTFDNFKIQVNGLILDSEFPTHLRSKYYQLCCSQKRFLHENLMNGKLASGMISETITISDAIQAAKPRMGLGDLERYDKTLKAFEDLGMLVGFLRTRIYKLLSISRKLEAKIESKRNERNEAVDLIRGLKKRLSVVEKLKVKLDDDIGGLMKNCKEQVVFMQIAGEPW